MITANFSAYSTYVTDSLFQWDQNRVLRVTGLNLKVKPEVHFSNANMNGAIPVQADLVNHVVVASIPNSLLQEPLRIYAHIGIYEGDEFKVVELVEIPVKPRKRPADYELAVDDYELYSFKRLENMIKNINDTWVDKNEEQVRAYVTSWLDEHPEATTTVQDGALTEAKFSDELKLMALKDYVTPEMYGAVGDGVTDDTAAVQTALDNGATACLLSKIYGITAGLNIGNGVNVFSVDGAEIVALKEMSVMLGVDHTEIDTPQTISVTLDGKGLAATGIRVDYCSNMYISKVRTRDMTGVHIAVAGGYECFVSDVYCRNNLTYVAGREIVGIVMGATDSRIDNAVVVNCNVGFDFTQSVHCMGIHPWNNDENYIKNSIGVRCSATCYIDGSEIDTAAIGVQQLNYFPVYLTNTRFMFTKAVSGFTPLYVENDTREVYCSGCVFLNAYTDKYALASQEKRLVLTRCTFNDTPNTDTNWANLTGFGADFYQLIVTDGTNVTIPANGCVKYEFTVPGIHEFDALIHTVAYDAGSAFMYKVTPGYNKITVNVFNVIGTSAVLQYARLNVVRLRRSGNATFEWKSYNPS